MATLIYSTHTWGEGTYPALLFEKSAAKFQPHFLAGHAPLRFLQNFHSLTFLSKKGAEVFSNLELLSL